MKKALSLLLSVFLVFIMLSGIFNTTSFASYSDTVTTQIEKINNSQYKLTVYLTDVKDLASLNMRVFYDNTIFSYCDSYADVDEDENYIYNGLWATGELYDKTGCTAAFITFSTISKKGTHPACEFILNVTGKPCEETEIQVQILEYLTENEDYTDDISSPVTVASYSFSFDTEDFFQYTKEGNSARITDYYGKGDFVIIPEKIEGLQVKEISLSAPPLFVCIPKSVTRIDSPSAFKDSVLLCASGSFGEEFAEDNSYKHFSYPANGEITSSGLLITDNQLMTSEAFTGNISPDVTPSQVSDFKSYIGTGSTVTLTNNLSEFRLSVVVRGDINGDSVCDVMDGMLCERIVNQGAESDVLTIAGCDSDNNGVITAQDFSALVNRIVSYTR